MQQDQISAQSEDIKDMRKIQLAIRETQTDQLAILQKILTALNGEGLLLDTASEVETLITHKTGSK